MEEYVYIQSTISIVVTAGLQNENVTNPDAHVPDRLRVNPVWPKLRMMIKSGQHVYPKFITEWNTVKALQKDGILTIGAVVKEENVDDSTKKATQDLSEELALHTKKTTVKIKDLKLTDVADTVEE